MAVSISNTVSVYPKIMHPQKMLNLSNLDRQCPLLMYLVLFYKPSDHSPDACMNNISVGSTVFSSVKAGLEETLSVWYPAAGRLSLNPNNGKLELWCNNDGAVLVEAVTQVKISQLGDLSQYNGFFENLVFKPVFNGNFSEMPLVAAQVTRFGCGGYSVGIGTSHSLFDGPATFDFLCAWASNATTSTSSSPIMAGNISRGHLHYEQHNPVHERGALLLCNPQNIHKSIPVTRVDAIDHLYQLIKQAASMTTDENYDAAGGKYCSNMQEENLVLRTFHLSGAMIESLKRKILGEKRGTSSSSSSFSCSSFEIVSAHIWKARTKALELQKERMVCLQFAMDTRNKTVPPLPKGFSGNAYVLASVALTAGELEGQSHEALIEKIREAKNSVTSEYANAYIAALEAPQATLPPLKELTLVSDWTRMPFHKVNFLHGEAAAATYASPLLSPIPQVAYFMQDPTDNRGIHVRIGLLPHTLNAFSHYFLTNMQ